MQLTVTGKQVDIGNALRARVEESLESILTKYFKTAIEAHVVIAKEAHLARAEVSLHIGRGIVVNASAARNDAATAFDSAAERVAKQLRRYKRRLRDHHAKMPELVEPVESARDYVLAPLADDDVEELAIRRSADGNRRDQHRGATADCRRGGHAHGSRRCTGAAVPQPVAWRAKPCLSTGRR